MATVFDNAMTAHVFAQFSQESGRSHNGNLFFEGRALYSYGRHYVAAYLAPAPGNPAGVGVALINADSYSVSTSRHVSNAASATRHRGRVWIPNLNPVAEILADALRNASPRLNPGCFPSEYGEPNAREVARYAVPRLAAHFAKPDNLPGDPRNASAEGRADIAASVAEVLKAAQADNLERRAAAIVAKAGKAAERAAVEKAKAKTRAELAALARFARTNPAEVVERMTADARRVAGKGGAVAYESGQWESVGREILRAMKAGKAAGHVARVRKASAVRAAIRATLPAFDAADMRANRLAIWRGRVAGVREGVRVAEAFREGREVRVKVTGGNRPGGAYDIDRGADKARELAAALIPADDMRGAWAAPAARIAGHNPAELAARLHTLAAELDSVGDDCRKAETRAARRRELAAIGAAVTIPAGEGNPGERAALMAEGARAAGRYASAGFRPGSLYPIPGAWAVAGWTPERFRELADKLKAAEKTERAELARIAAEETERARAEALRIWRDGGRVPAELARHTPRALPDGSAYIRANGVERDAAGAITGGELETSQGARVPLAHALRAFRFLKACRDKGEAWQANGRTLPVGQFRIDRVESDGGFRAGCHRIAWAEVSALAERLGVAELAPADTTETRAHA